MMRFLIGGRAPAFLAGLGVTISPVASGCWTPPTRTQSQNPANMQRTNTNPGATSGNSAMNGNPMAGSGAIPTPPSGTPYGPGMNQNGMNNNVMPASATSNGMAYTNNGMQQNMPNGMTRPQPGLGNLTPPTANQSMSGTPPFMNQQPMGSGIGGPIANNAGAGQVQPAKFERPAIATAPIGNPIPTNSGAGPADLAPPPANLMGNRDPKLFGQNDRLPAMQTPAEAYPLKVEDPMSAPPSSGQNGLPRLGPPPGS